MKTIGLFNILLCLFLLVGIPYTILSQTNNTPPKDTNTVHGYYSDSYWKLNLNTGVIAPADDRFRLPNFRNVPFDVPFILELEGSQNMQEVEFNLVEIEDLSDRYVLDKCADPKCYPNDSAFCISHWKRFPFQTGNAVITVPPLKPNTRYMMYIHTTMKATEEQKKDFLKKSLDSFQRIISQKLANYANGTDLNIIDDIRYNWINELNEFYREIFLQDTTARICAQAAFGRLQQASYAKLNDQSNSSLSLRVINAYTEYSNPLTLMSNAISSAFLNESRDLAISNTINETFTQAIRLSAQDKKGRTIDSSYLDSLFQELFNNPYNSFNLSGRAYKDGNSLLYNSLEERLDYTTLLDRIKHLEANIDIIGKAIKDQTDPGIKSVLNQTKLQAEKNLITLHSYKFQRDKIAKEIEEYINRLNILTNAVYSTTANTVAAFVSRSAFRFIPDVGIAFLPMDKTLRNQPSLYNAPSNVIPYFGLQFHVVPINREVPFELFRRAKRVYSHWPHPIWRKLGTAISFNIGITAVRTNTERFGSGFKGMLDQYGLLSGVGIRLNDYIRINAGILLVRRDNPSPLITEYIPTLYPFMSLSIDMDVRKYITGLVDWIRKP